MAHRLIGRWRLRTGATIVVKHVYDGLARVSFGGYRQAVVRVRELDAVRRGGGMIYVGR